MLNNIVEVLKEGHHIVFVTKDKYKYYINEHNLTVTPSLEMNMRLLWNFQNKPYIEIKDINDKLVATPHVNSQAYREQSKWFVDERFNV